MLRTKYNPLRPYKWKVITFDPSSEESHKLGQLYYGRYSISWDPKEYSSSIHTRFNVVLKDNLLNKERELALFVSYNVHCPYYIYANEITGAIITQVMEYLDSNPTIAELESIYEFIKSDTLPRNCFVGMTNSTMNNNRHEPYGPSDIISYGSVIMISSDHSYRANKYNMIGISFDNHVLMKPEIPDSYEMQDIQITIKDYPDIEKKIIKKLRCPS